MVDFTEFFSSKGRDMWGFFLKGGIFMWPIATCSVIALAIFFERLWGLRNNRVLPRGFLISVRDLVRRDKVPEAVVLCDQDDSPISRIICAALRNFGKKREVIKERIEEVGRKEAAGLGRFVEGLSTIANVSTMFGLLGTIQGLIIVFSVISEQVVVNPPSLASGISVALYTTAFGLSVAIPTIIAHRYISGRVDALVLQMEETSVGMIELFHEKEEEAIT